MPQRWALRLVIEGDVRFLSHLDSMRAVERAAARGHVPLRFSQGFNPHPVLSFACPRPVGVATRDDLVVLSLDEPMAGEDVQARMNDHAPRGMHFDSPRMLETSRVPRPQRITYEVFLDAAKCRDAAQRLAELAETDAWPMERRKPPKKHGRAVRSRMIDLRALVESISLDSDASALRWTARPQGDLWARPQEVLELVGVGERENLADVVRTCVEYCP